CIGGNNTAQTYADVFLLSWNPKDKTVDIKMLPSLPEPCANTSAAILDNVIYVAGGTRGESLDTAMANFWALDMSQMNNPEAFRWQSLLPWPGPSRAFNLTVTQHNGQDDCIYVLSGRRASEAQPDQAQFLTDVYEFTPSCYEAASFDAASGHYTGRTNPWRRRCDVPRCVMAGTVIKMGQSHIMVLGGDDGALWGKGTELKDNHPGFPKTGLAYHTITDTWIKTGSIPANQVTTTAVRWGSDAVNDPIVIPSGEIRPRVRSPKMWSIVPVHSPGKFGAADFLVLGIYLAAMIGVGVYFSFRNKNSDDYFRGGQRVPWFVAGLSIFATMLSSVTFIAIPAKAYMTDWVYFLVNMMAVLVTPAVIYLFLPFFRNIDATSAYEYLEKRFNRFIRLFASASFIIFQVGRMAIVMYLPALAISAITPLTEIQCILLMGLLSVIYCTMGGLEAVVWTDTIQSFILFGGPLFCILLILYRLDGGVGQFVSMSMTDDKFHLVNWDFSSVSMMTAALWVVVLGGIGQSLVPYASDMAVVQRYMSVSSTQQARRAIWTNAIAVIPATILFFAVGTALYVFYKTNPERLDPTFKNDAIFPLFIARELPIGVAGLVIAGLFAAAQSTIATSMNSSATAFVTDFIRPFHWVKTEAGYLRLARVMTFTLGCMGTAMAVFFAMSDIKSLWDMFMTILGLIGGAMCGLFCLGIFTVRANSAGAMIGAVCGAAGLYWVQEYTSVHLLLYATIGIVLCFVVGYLASLLFPASTKSVDGLTIYTLGQDLQESVLN
ncbi:MAG: sodium/solute symporter, partial [Anaerohalosphaeraceae bacterium]